MADLLTTLATQTGIDPELVKKGMGVLLAFLKKHLDPALFDKLGTVIPDAPQLVNTAESIEEEKGSGILGAVAGLAGKLFGGQSADMAAILSGLSKVGFNSDQIQKFLPKAYELLAAHLPPDLVEKIKGFLPAEITAPAVEAK
jgi:hypothetical protein